MEVNAFVFGHVCVIVGCFLGRYIHHSIYQPVFDGYLGNAVEVSPILMFVWRSRGSEAIYFGEYWRLSSLGIRSSRLFVEFTSYEPDNQVILTSTGWI